MFCFFFIFKICDVKPDTTDTEKSYHCCPTDLCNNVGSGEQGKFQTYPRQYFFKIAYLKKIIDSNVTVESLETKLVNAGITFTFFMTFNDLYLVPERFIISLFV